MDERFIRAAGYLFTWRREAGHTRVDMFRETRVGGARYGVASVVSASDDRAAVYATALAMVAWVRSLGVAPRRSVKATAVAECLAVRCVRGGLMLPILFPINCFTEPIAFQWCGLRFRKTEF